MRFLLTTALLLPLCAHAQVATDDHALDALKPTAPPATVPAAPTPTRTKPPARSQSGSGKTGQSTSRHATHPAPSRTLGQVKMPVAPPTYPVLAPPPFVLPAHAPVPPPPVPVRADAPGTATQIAGGLRVTFGAGVSDLNPATLASIRAVAAKAAADPSVTVAVTAWAPGMPDDPSTPRRLSLDRALAVRAVLINAGMVSDRIRAQAKGIPDTTGAPPDRADIQITK